MVSSKVFIDCGTNLCQGLKDISERYGVDDTWKVISFEANKATFDAIDKSKFDHVDFYNLGVWIDDSTRYVNVEYVPRLEKNEVYNLIDDVAIDQPIGGATNILDDNFNFLNSPEDLVKKKFDTIQCFDFSQYIVSFSIDDFVIVKLDIEGSEYPVLEKMIKDDTLKYIDILYVEWHNKFLTNKYDENSIRSAISAANITLYEWN